jgi:hypothetical protein
VTLVTNSLEGVTPSGTTITNGNSGGASGTAFNTTSIGTGASLVSDSTHVAHGSLAMKAATAGTSTVSYGNWSTAMGAQTQVWFRSYLFITANPATVLTPILFFNTTTQAGGLQITTGGKLQLIDANSATILTGTLNVSLNNWFRVEGFIITSATVGQMEYKLFLTPDSATADEVMTSAATQNTNTQVVSYRYGTTLSSANQTIWHDDLGLSNVGYIGPSQPLAGGGGNQGGPTVANLGRNTGGKLYKRKFYLGL